MKFAIIAALVPMLLSACETARSDTASADLLILPDVVSYPAETLAAGAAEIEGGACPILSNVFMPDYLVMRDQSRAAGAALEGSRLLRAVQRL